MSKYLESVCLWEQNEKYLFSFEGFYVKFACKKQQPQWQSGVREEKGVQTGGRTAKDYGIGSPSAVAGTIVDPELEGTGKQAGVMFLCWLGHK